MPFDTLTRFTVTNTRKANRRTFAPPKGWRERLMAENARREAEREPELVKDLRAARVLIASGWSQLCFARDADGISCPIEHPDAKAFCAVGAVRRAINLRTAVADDNAGRIERVVGFMEMSIAPLSLVGFNDMAGRTQAEMLEVFDHGIARALEVSHA